MTDTPHRKKSSSSSSRRRSRDKTDWGIIGIVAAMSAVFLALMGYAAFCPWNPSADERDAEAIAARLQKVGSVVIAEAAAAPAEAASAEAAPAEAAPAAAPAEAAPAAALDAEAGKKLYNTTCQMCHAAGIGGAPKFGNKEEWAPRIATGMDAMMKVVFEGKGAMPARGSSSASDDELRAAVQYMTDNAK